MSVLTTTGIQNFYDEAIKSDFQRKFQFRLLQLGDTLYDSAMKNKYVYLTTASLPQRQIANQPTPFMGLAFNVPGAATYPNSDNWALTFRLANDFSVRSTLESWNRNIFDDQTSTGNYSIPNRNNIVEIGLLNMDGEVIRNYILVGVYCVSIGDISYDLTSNGEIQTFTANIAYQYWYLKSGESGL